MISEPTQAQLATLKIDPVRPLLVCDVDDVVVDFIADFTAFLNEQALTLRPTPRLFHGEVVHMRDSEYIGERATIDLLDEFFATRTKAMRPVTGAVASLTEIAKGASVVFLTNLPHSAGDFRRTNMKALGLPFPVITNSGPKGPAIEHLANLTSGPTAFIDDSPFFISTARERVPHVSLVHFLHNPDFAVHAPVFDFVSLRANHWDEARPHLLDVLKA